MKIRISLNFFQYFRGQWAFRGGLRPCRRWYVRDGRPGWRREGVRISGPLQSLRRITDQDHRGKLGGRWTAVSIQVS